MERTENSTFSKLQPICVKLACDGHEQDIDKLQELVKNIENEKINVYIDYIVFPIRLIILKKSNEKLIIRAIEFMNFLFRHCEIKQINTFSDNFLLLINLLTNIEEPEIVSDASEELKLSVCICLSSLVKNVNEDILLYMYDKAFQLTLAQAFFVLVQLLKYERAKHLRLVVLETIGMLSYSSSLHTSKSLKVEERGSESLTHFFPGLTSGLVNVVCGDIKQGQNVLRLALNVFSKLVVLVLNDESFEKCNNSKNSISESDKNGSKLTNVVKDRKWYKETSTILKTMIKNINILVTHDNWKVKLEYLKFAENILFNCLKTLESSISILLSAIFALSVDSQPEISQYSLDLINKFSKKIESCNAISLVSVIQEDIHSSTSKLIQSKFSANDSEKLAALRAIQGYIKLFGESVDNLISFSNVERIFLSLINIIEFDVRIIHLVEDISVSTSPSDLIPVIDSWPKKKFLYIQNEKIIDTISDVCNYLGCFSNVRLVTDYLLEKLHGSKCHELECIYLIGRVFEGISLRKSNNNSAVIDDILTELLILLDDSKNDVVSSITNNFSNEESLRSRKILKKCLVSETIGISAKALKTEFQILLRKYLFFVLEQTGDSNSLVSSYGRICLYTISNYCKYSTVSSLIQDNVDYIMNSLTINFHHFVTRPEMAVVLSVCMKESNEKILPHFKDSIKYLLNLLDSNQDKAFMLLKIIKSIVMSIKSWFISSEETILNSQLSQYKDIKTVLLAYKKSKLQEKEIDFEYKNEQGTENQNEDEAYSEKTDYKAPPPLHVSIVIDILKRCCNFQSSNDLFVKISSLEIIECSLHILGPYEIQLHPIVHELWSQFIWRFNEEATVFLTAFKVLLVMADKCRDFVRMRVMKDVSGKLINFLRKNYSYSLKHNFRNYQYQNACKLHLLILSEIGYLYTKIDVAEKDIAELAEVCLPYLNKTQSKLFQEAAHKTLQFLNSLDCDAMWLYYNVLYSENEFLTPPHQSLHTLHFPNCSKAPPEYKFNF